MSEVMLETIKNLICCIEDSDNISPPIIPALKKLKKAMTDADLDQFTIESNKDIINGVKAVINAAEGEPINKGISVALKETKKYMRPIEREEEEELEKTIIKFKQAQEAQMEELKDEIEKKREKQRIIEEYKQEQLQILEDMRAEEKRKEKEKAERYKRNKEWELKYKKK